MHYDAIPMIYDDIPAVQRVADSSRWKELKEASELLPVNNNCTSTKIVKNSAHSGNRSSIQSTLFSGKKSVNSQKKAIVESVCMGFLPLTFMNNPGIECNCII